MFKFCITVIAVALYPILPILVYIRLLWRGRGSKQSLSSQYDESGNICQNFITRDFISLKIHNKYLRKLQNYFFGCRKFKKQRWNIHSWWLHIGNYCCRNCWRSWISPSIHISGKIFESNHWKASWKFLFVMHMVKFWTKILTDMADT